MMTIGTAGVTGRWSALGSCRRSRNFCRGSGYSCRGSGYWVLGSGYTSRGSRKVLSRGVAACWSCPGEVSLPLTATFAPVAPAPAGLPATRAITSRTATILTSIPLCALYVRLTSPALYLRLTSILLYRDASLDPGPHQLGPQRVSEIGRMVAVAPDERATRRDLALARRVEIDHLGAIPGAEALERLVEEDVLLGDRLSRAMLAEAWGHDQIGNQIHDHDSRRLVAQAPENRVDVALVLGHVYPRRDVVRPDRQRDEMWRELDRPLELAPQHIRRRGATHAEIDDACGGIHRAQPLVQPAHVVELRASGADAFHGAVAEGHVPNDGAAVGGQGSSPEVERCPRLLWSAGRARRREQRGEHGEAPYQRAASSSVRRYHGASGKVMGRIAGSVTPASRYARTKASPASGLPTAPTARVSPSATSPLRSKAASSLPRPLASSMAR